MRTPLRFLLLAPVFLLLAAPSHPERACTMDAKLCLDGSYVGRDGYNDCEWEPCPGETQACTEEMRLCPDGTGVARTGPNCEFAPCPGEDMPSCAPYVCANGKTHPRCSEDGHVINYFAAPCHMDGGEEGAPFEDVSSDHANADAIFYVKSQGIVEGYADGAYRPNAMINRAEFVKILLTAKYSGRVDNPECFPGDNPSIGDPIFTTPHLFSDVGDEWFASFVCVAKIESIIDGYADGTFRPSANINFAEAAKIIVKTFGLETSMMIPECEDECPWYRVYVEALANAGAIPITIDDFGESITRGEMAEMIYRLETGNTRKDSESYEGLMYWQRCLQDGRYCVQEG